MKIRFFLIAFNLLAALGFAQNACNGLWTLNNSTVTNYSSGQISGVGNSTVVSAGINGLCVGPLYSFTSAATPLLWTTRNDSLFAIAGTTLLPTGHAITNTLAVNLAGSSNFIYALASSSGQVYKYSGGGNAQLLTTISSASNGGLIAEIAADNSDNFYIMDLQINPRLYKHNSAGLQLCYYDLQGLSSATNAAVSFWITGNTLSVLQAANLYTAAISGPTLNFTQVTGVFPIVEDVATCALSTEFSSTITSSNGNCFLNNTSLSAVAPYSITNYSWSGSGIIGALNQNSVVANQTGLYTCTLSSNECYWSTSIASISVTANPTVQLNGPSIICSSVVASYTAFGATNYTWSIGTSTTNLNPLAFTTSTVLSVQGAIGGCIATSSLAINVLITPVISILASSTTICEGQQAVLSAFNAQNFSWLNLANTSAQVTVSPISNTTYTVYGSISNGCNNTQTIQINVTPSPSLAATISSSVICIGQTQTLSAMGANTYTWLPIIQFNSVAIVSPTASTIYTCIAAIGSCTAAQTISTSAYAYPSLSLTPTSTLICSSESVNISASGANSYSWLPMGLSGSSVSFSLPSNTTLTVIGFGSGGCNSQTTRVFSVNPTPALTTTVMPAVFCTTIFATTLNYNAFGASNYTWIPSNTNFSGLSVTAPNYVSSSVIVTYTVIGGTNNCTAMATPSILVLPSPTINVSPAMSTICIGGSQTLSLSGAVSYTWANNAGGSNNTSAVVTPTNAYSIYAATGTGTNGCQAIGSGSVILYGVPTMTVSGTNSVCAGSSATMQANGVSSYSWSSGIVGTNSIAIVTPSASQTYTVIGSSAAGCTTNPHTYSITVVQIPTVVTSQPSYSVCAGSFITIPATGAQIYSWSPSGTIGGSLYFSPTQSQTITIKGYIANCTSTISVPITVYPAPIFTVTTARDSVCAGETTTLMANGADAYFWPITNVTTATTIVTPQSPVSIFSVSGSYTTTGCSSTKTISIIRVSNPSLFISASNTLICPGATVGIQAQGALTYSWVNSALNGTYSVISPTTTAHYKLIGYRYFCMDEDSILIKVNQPASVTISGSTLVCKDSQVNLTASGANNYTWSPIPANTASISFVANNNMVLSVAATGTNTCVGTKTIQVQTRPTPTVGAQASKQIVCELDQVSFSAFGVSTYTWLGFGNGSTVAVIANQILNQQIFVCGTDTNGCKTGTISVTVQIENCTGFKNPNFDGASIQIIPNPNNGKFHIKNFPISEIRSVSVVDYSGKTVYKVDEINDDLFDLVLSPGLYYAIFEFYDREHRRIPFLVHAY